MDHSIYYQECPVCKGQKKLKVAAFSHQKPRELLATRTEFWGYGPTVHEEIKEAFCSECGLKFIAP